jgi:hypothetical protein
MFPIEEWHPAKPMEMRRLSLIRIEVNDLVVGLLAVQSR